MDYVPNFLYLCIVKEMNMIERKLSKVIKEQLFRGKAIILVGSRQVGKTTLLGELVRQSDKRILSLNCDEPEVQTMLTDTNVAKLRTIIGNNELVVIDEAQKVNNIGLTLKLIVDNIKDVQVVATGSSAFELRNQLNEPLTGRKFEYQMFPISSGEIIDTYGLLEEKRTLENRLVYGSYPDIIMHPEEARRYLTELTQSYLYKDVLSLDSLRKPQLLDKLLQALAFQVGSEVSTNELARTLPRFTREMLRHFPSWRFEPQPPYRVETSQEDILLRQWSTQCRHTAVLSSSSSQRHGCTMGKLLHCRANETQPLQRSLLQQLFLAHYATTGD